MRSTFLILLLLWLLAIFCGSSSALRCYTCEDCDEQSEITELEVCSAPTVVQQQPVAVGSPASSPAAAPASVAAPAPADPPAAAPPAAPAAASEGTDEDYGSEEDESAPQPTLGIMPAASNNLGMGAAAGAAPGAIAAAAPAPAAAAAASAASASSVSSESGGEDEDEDYDERKRRRRTSRQAMNNNSRPVCYIASLRREWDMGETINTTEITNRGCTFVVDDNSTAACTNLYNGWEVVGCQLCESNGCNSPIHATVVGQWNTGSSSRVTGLTALGMTLLSLLILLARVS